MIRKIVLAGIALASLGFFALRPTSVNAQSGNKAVCVPTVSNTCPPAPCAACRMPFQSCGDRTCTMESKTCVDDPNGTTCTQTLVSLIAGTKLTCVSGAIDWSNCLGWNKCVPSGTSDIAGNRYTCT